MVQKSLLFFLAFSALVCYSDAKVTCFDEKQDLDGIWNWYPPSAPVKYVSNKETLPAAFAKLNLPGTGLWYLEGAGTGQEYKLTLQEKYKPYATRSTNVQLYVSYYDKNPRRGTVEPAKGLLPLQQLPVTSGNTWSSATFDINPRADEPLELSFFLSRGNVVIIDKIILTVDEPLPKSNPESACVKPVATTAKPVAGATPTAAGGAATASTGTTGVKTGGAPAPTLPSVLSGRNAAEGACQSYALPECKCNCMCNCAKC